MKYIKFYEVLPDEKAAIIKSYTSRTTSIQPPSYNTYNRSLPNSFEKNLYDHHMNRKSFTIPGNRGRVVIKIFDKPCDISKGECLYNNGYIVLSNHEGYDFFVDKFTVLETLISQYSFLMSTFYFYDPKGCGIC
jgi:hypothetical protein